MQTPSEEKPNPLIFEGQYGPDGRQINYYAMNFKVNEATVFYANVSDMTSCCSIKVLHNYGVMDAAVLDDIVNHPMFHQTIWGSTGWTTCERCLITVTDHIQSNRDFMTSLKKAGWKELDKVQSCHGNYFVHILALERA